MRTIQSVFLFRLPLHVFSFGFAAASTLSTGLLAQEWPMRGRTSDRVSSVSSKNGPQSWDIKKVQSQIATIGEKNDSGARAGTVRWTQGGFWQAMCDPVVANGLLWIGTANPIVGIKEDAGVLACFDAKTGELLYQHISQKIGIASQDWPITGNTSSPFILGNRLWFCTNRLEVICLNIQPLVERTGEPTMEWTVDFKTRYKMVPTDVHLGNRASRCSIVGVEGRIFVNTTNSFSYDRRPTINPDAPSLVCLDQKTGETVWTDHSPGGDIARNQHCNPVIFQQDANNYVAIGQGDGFVRAFACETGKVKWKFDLNTTEERNEKNAFRKRRLLTESPVFDGERLYFAIGDDREASFERGGIYCIDPSGSGDISAECRIDGNSMANPNSKLLWKHTQLNGEQIHTSIAGLCVTASLLFSADIDGIVKCFDKQSGKLHWKHEMQATAIGTPLVVGDSVYVTDEDGDVEVLSASAEYHFIASMNLFDPIESSPIYADETLFFVTRRSVFAVGEQ
jgi:outer membrane protein assembly factor BamB